jgi:heat shock protein HslJ
MENTKVNSWLLGIMIFSLSVLTACGGTPATTSPSVELAGTTWQLTELNGQSISSVPLMAVYFTASDTIIGSTGCNIFTGSYNLMGDQIDISVTTSTTMTCPEAHIVLEEAFLGIMTIASNYETQGGELYMRNPDDSNNATFSDLPQRSIEGTSWVVNAFNNGSGVFANLISGTEITAEFGTDGNLTGTAGCNNYTTGYEVDGEQITIGPTAVTAMMCQEPAGVMDQESAYLTALEKAVVYKNLGLLMAIWGSDDDPVALYISSEAAGGSN